RAGELPAAPPPRNGWPGSHTVSLDHPAPRGRADHARLAARKLLLDRRAGRRHAPPLRSRAQPRSLRTPRSRELAAGALRPGSPPPRSPPVRASGGLRQTPVPLLGRRTDRARPSRHGRGLHALRGARAALPSDRPAPAPRLAG